VRSVAPRGVTLARTNEVAAVSCSPLPERLSAMRNVLDPLDRRTGASPRLGTAAARRQQESQHDIAVFPLPELPTALGALPLSIPPLDQVGADLGIPPLVAAAMASYWRAFHE